MPHDGCVTDDAAAGDPDPSATLHGAPGPGATGTAPGDGDVLAARRRLRVVQWVSVSGIAAALAILAVGFATGAYSSISELQTLMARVGPVAPALYLLLQAAQVVVPVIPGGIGIVAGPVLFGPVLGTVYNYVGICAGSLFAFHLARRYATPLVDSLFPAKLRTRYRRWTDHANFTRVFALAIVAPIAPDDFLCYIAGTTSMSWRTYTLIILLGKPWAIIAYTFGLVWIASLIPGIGGLM